MANLFSRIFGGAVRSPYRTQQSQFAQQLGNMSGAYQNRLARSSEAVGRFDPMYQAAVRTRLNYLQEDPYANERDALALGRASGNIATQYGGAQANLARMLAQRGLSGGIEAGALANLEAARMGQQGAMQYQTAMDRIAARNAAMQEAVGLAGQARGMYGGEEMSNLAGLQGLYQTGYGMYGDMAAAEEAAKNAQRQRMLQTIQAIGSFSQMGRSQPTNSTATGARTQSGMGGSFSGYGRMMPSDFGTSYQNEDPVAVQPNTRRRNFLGF